MNRPVCETPLTDPTIEAACEVMHDAYENAASGAGWETQEASRKPWAEVPEANKATMRAAVAALILHLRHADHDCPTCQDCIHHESGVGCCGCYDGVCCVAQPADAAAVRLEDHDRWAENCQHRTPAWISGSPCKPCLAHPADTEAGNASGGVVP